MTRLQAAFAVQKEQVAHLQQKIAATNQALEENEARQHSLERQLAALTSNVSDHEFSRRKQFFSELKHSQNQAAGNSGIDGDS